MTISPGQTNRQHVGVNLTAEARDGLHGLAAEVGCSLAALLEAVGLLGLDLPDDVVVLARQVYAARNGGGRRPAPSRIDGREVAPEPRLLGRCECARRPMSATVAGDHHAPGCELYDPSVAAV